MVAFALIGIVAMQLWVVKLGVGIGHALEHTELLQRENSALAIEDSSLSSGERVERLALTRGMVLAPPGALHFDTLRGPLDARLAAAALAKPAQTQTTGAATGAEAIPGATSGTETSPGAANGMGAGPGATAGTETSGMTAGAETGSGATTEANAGAATGAQTGASAGGEPASAPAPAPATQAPAAETPPAGTPAASASAPAGTGGAAETTSPQAGSGGGTQVPPGG